MGGIFTSISGMDGRCRWSVGIYQRHADEALKKCEYFIGNDIITFISLVLTRFSIQDLYLNCINAKIW